MNGVNGGAMPNMVGLPMPAGHQTELNYIYGMVEELSRQLADNKRALEEVVSGVGRVRNRAKQLSVGNDDILASAVDEIAAQDKNINTLLSILSESLEKAKYSRDANASLLSQYAAAINNMVKQLHDYKSRHVADIAAWHRSYRSQLAEAREENSRLREQIWDMQSHAGKANESLRLLRKAYDADKKRWEARVEMTALRQEVRFWKRMACPEIAEDDREVWSDDDDIIDVGEKIRLERLREEQERRVAATRANMDELRHLQSQRDAEEMERRERLGVVDEGGDPVVFDVTGSVPMQREGGPVPPPRPGSAASSTGSTGRARLD